MKPHPIPVRDVMFRHYRGVEDVNKPRHINDPPTVTIALCVNKNVINVGVAVCNPCDAFVKRVGRVKSLGRALAHDRETVTSFDLEPQYNLTTSEGQDAAFDAAYNQFLRFRKIQRGVDLCLS